MLNGLILWAIVYGIAGIIFGAFCGTVASLKGHEKTTWFFAGFFFNIVGLLAAIGLPDRAKV